jgi:hypothetical protein
MWWIEFGKKNASNSKNSKNSYWNRLRNVKSLTLFCIEGTTQSKKQGKNYGNWKIG